MGLNFNVRQSKAKKFSFLGHVSKGAKRTLQRRQLGNERNFKKQGYDGQRLTRSDYEQSQKVSELKGIDDVLTENDFQRQKRVRHLRKKLLKDTLFSLEGDNNMQFDGKSDSKSEGHVQGDPEKIWDLVRDAEDDESIASLADSEGDSELDTSATRARFETAEDRKRRREGIDEGSVKKSRKDRSIELMNKTREARQLACRNKALQIEMLHSLNSTYSEIIDELERKPTRSEPSKEMTEAVSNCHSREMKRLTDYRSQKQIQDEDEFDKLLVSMKGSARGVASDRIKSSAELAFDRARTLDEIERQRQEKLSHLKHLDHGNDSDDAESDGIVEESESEDDESRNAAEYHSNDDEDEED